MMSRGLFNRLPKPMFLDWGHGEADCEFEPGRPAGVIGLAYGGIVTPKEVLAGLERLATAADVQDATLRARVLAAIGCNPDIPRPQAPRDQRTLDAVKAAGYRYEACPDGYSYVVTRPGARELTEEDYFSDETRKGVEGIPTRLNEGWGLGPATCTYVGHPQRGLFRDQIGYEETITPEEVVADLQLLGQVEQLRDVTLRARVVLPDRCAHFVLDARAK
jgi:hypothetical protein